MCAALFGLMLVCSTIDLGVSGEAAVAGAPAIAAAKNSARAAKKFT